jgi:hypothetical protein
MLITVPGKEPVKPRKKDLRGGAIWDRANKVEARTVMKQHKEKGSPGK